MLVSGFVCKSDRGLLCSGLVHVWANLSRMLFRWVASLPTQTTVWWEHVCLLLYTRWTAHDAFVYTKCQIMGTLNIWLKIMIIHFLSKKKNKIIENKKANSLNCFIYFFVINTNVSDCTQPLFSNILCSLWTDLGTARIWPFCYSSFTIPQFRLKSAIS